MEKAVVFLLVGLAVMASAKPYEPARKTSAPDQLSLYPWYERNFLYGTDRIPKEYLDRLFGERVKDSSVDLPPFVQMPDELPNDLIGNEAEHREEQSIDGKPIADEKSPESQNDRIDNEEQQPEEQPKSPESQNDRIDNEEDHQEQPKDEKHEKPIDEKASNDGIEADREKPKQPEPDQKPQQDDKDREQQQDGEGQKPNANHAKGKHSDEHEKRPKPGHALIPKPPRKGNRPGMEKPPKGIASHDRQSPQQPGKEVRRDGPPQPPPRKPESPLVQINVNVAAAGY